MTYYKTVKLKNGTECVLKNGTAADGKAVLENFLKAHGETDFLMSYPDENRFGPEDESDYLRGLEENADAVELLAVVNGAIAGTAGIEAVGKNYKVKHRAEFGISVLKEYWGLGIGRALTEACLECARSAGFSQVELTAVTDNERAIALYESVGFREYGRNPKGFCSRINGWQELVYMLKEP